MGGKGKKKEGQHTELDLAFSYNGGEERVAARASIPMGASNSPLCVCLQGLAQIADKEDTGRKWFCPLLDQFVVITPKTAGAEAGGRTFSWAHGGGLLTTQPEGRTRFDEEVLWFVIQNSILEVERAMGAEPSLPVIDVQRIFVTGLSLGGEAALNLASLPGVGRCLAGLVPTACRGSDHLVFTEGAKREMWHLPIWATQMATDRREYRMNTMLAYIAGGREPRKCLEHVEYPDVKAYESRTRGPLWEYHREVRKFEFCGGLSSPEDSSDGDKSVGQRIHGAGRKELWEIYDSRSDSWTGSQDRVKHHDSWTCTWREGVGYERRTFGKWALEQGRNRLRVDVITGEISMQVTLRRSIPRAVAARTEAWPLRIGVWRPRAEREAVHGAGSSEVGHTVGSRTLWKYGFSDAGVTADDFLLMGVDTLQTARVERSEGDTGDCIQETLLLEVRRGQHLRGASLADAARENSQHSTAYYQWWTALEASRRELFLANCAGLFDCAIDYNSGRAVYGVADSIERGAQTKRFVHPLPRRAMESFVRSEARLSCLSLPALKRLAQVLEARTDPFNPTSFHLDFGEAEGALAGDKGALLKQCQAALKAFDYAEQRRRLENDAKFHRRWIDSIAHHLRNYCTALGEDGTVSVHNRGMPVSKFNSMRWLDRTERNPAYFPVSRRRLRAWDHDKVFQLQHKRGCSWGLWIRFRASPDGDTQPSAAARAIRGG